jgi:hypothetical protein
MSIEPLRASITVARDPSDAFRIFTREMGTWWPLAFHSLAADEHEGRVKAESVTVEEHEGGRIVERMSDGTEGTWGTVTTWDPPARLVVAWKPNLNANPPTELEIRFIPAPDGTLVELEHRGWERLGAIAREARESYGEGWVVTLSLFAAATEREASP